MIGGANLNLDKLKFSIEDYLKSNGLVLYDIKYEREGEDYFLRIFIDNDDYNITLEDLAKANDYISSILDNMDLDLPPYYLEVSSPGAEREIRNNEEITKAINAYVHVELERDFYEGYLLDFDGEVVTIKVNFKGRIKNLKIELKDIKFFRYAVKI